MRHSLAALLAASALACSGDPGPARRVVLVSVDTLRADHLPLYGYERDTAPVLGRMATEDGVVFESCYAQASWTLPSHMSMLTGLYPIAHGVVSSEKRLSENVVTLAERLGEEGFATAAFTDGGYVARGWGLEDGFDEYNDDRLVDENGDWGLARVLPHAERWLRAHRSDDTFLFLHTYEVHAPYVAPEPWSTAFQGGTPPEGDAERLAYLRTIGECEEYQLERFESVHALVATYDGMILHADHQLGRLFEMLREQGLYDETLIVITSDHGESFLDLGVYAGHGLLLNEAETHVPLVVKFPDNRFAGTRVDALVEGVDIAPTVLHAMRVTPGGCGGTGQDLEQLLLGADDPTPLAFSYGAALQSHAVRDKDWALLKSSWGESAERAALERLQPEHPELVLARIPRETRLVPLGTIGAPNQLAEHPEVEARLDAALSTWEFSQYVQINERGAPGERAALDEHDLERLRALGYL